MKLFNRNQFRQLLVLVVSLSSFLYVLNIKIKAEIVDDNDFRTREDVVYDRDIAITFTKSLAKLIFDIPNEPTRKNAFMKIFDECFSSFDTKPHEYEPILRAFFLRCFEIRKNVAKTWNNSIFNTMIMTKLATVRIKDHGEDSTCQVSLPYNLSTDQDKIEKLFNSYFHQFVTTPSNATPFITSMFSRYRDRLPDNSFTNLNRQSGVMEASHKQEKSAASLTAKNNPVIDNKMKNLGSQN